MSQPKVRVAMLGPSLEQNGGIATIEKLTIKYAPSEIRIHHIASHDEGSLKHRFVVFGKALWKFVWMVLQREVDIVHLHLSERGSVLRKVIITLIASIFRKPVLMHANGAEFHLFFSNLPKLLQQGLSWIFRRCTSFIVVSKSWKDFYAPTLGLKEEQIFVLPNPVEVPSQVPERANVSKVTLVVLGRVGQRKGTFDLIKAYASLPIEQKDKSQLIVGGDGEVEQGRELVESLNLTENITFIGWVNSEQRDEILAKADIFVLPSYNEGLPLALLEAMAWGLPPITTPVAGIPEVVTSNKNGLLITPGNIQQLSEAMQCLIENNSLRLSLGSAARETVTALDVNKYWCCLANIYQSVLQAH